MIESYPSVFNLGHNAVAALLEGPVIIEEKVDGSQISFRLDHDGELHIRSKGAAIILDHPDGLFDKCVEVIKRLQDRLRLGWTYRGEYLKKPRHNGLVYDRIPNNHIIIFDIQDRDGNWLWYSDKEEEAKRLGLEVVPVLHIAGTDNNRLDLQTIRDLLESVSVLGGQKIEGVVIKPLFYDVYGKDKKVLMGKYVSEAFKEVQHGAWKEANPSSGDIIQQLTDRYNTPARWMKAIQHLRESGELEDSPQDIGKLMKEVSVDIRLSEEDEIKKALFDYAWKKIARGVTKGLPEWYKQRLLEKQFAVHEWCTCQAIDPIDCSCSELGVGDFD